MRANPYRIGVDFHHIVVEYPPNLIMRNSLGSIKAASIVFLLAAFVSRPAHGAPGDWGQWRGPNRDGISKETGFLTEWPANGPALLWKATGLGDGYSTVAVVGDRLYTTGDRADAGYVVALGAADGKKVWEAKLGKPGAPGWGGFAGPRATPTLDGDLLFTVDQWGEVVCLEAATGREVWRKNMTADFGGERPEWGFSESPLVDADQVVFTPGGSKGSVVALNKKSGAVVWQSKEITDPAHYSSIIVADFGGKRHYIQLTAEHVFGLEAKTGKLLWKAERKGKTAVIPTPVFDNGYVFVTSGYSVGCNLFKLSPDQGGFKAEQVYQNKVLQNHHGGVIKIGDFIYGHSDSKGWTCLDFMTGEAKWQDKTGVGKGSIVYADDRFYIRQEDKPGTIGLIEASPAGYKEHGRFQQPNLSGKKTWPHPVVAGGRLFIRDQDVLLCYDVKSK